MTYQPPHQAPPKRRTCPGCDDLKARLSECRSRNQRLVQALIKHEGEEAEALRWQGEADLARYRAAAEGE
jgi:hypothetical protein